MTQHKITLIDIVKDIEQLKLVVEKAFSDTPDSNLSDWFSFEEMTVSISNNRGVGLKAINENNRIVGIIHAHAENPIYAKEGTEKWVITNVAVVPEVAGQGVGSQLISAIESECKKRRVKKLFVHTNKGDDKVIHFYQKNGFQDASWVKDYYYAGDAVFFIKYLK